MHGRRIYGIVCMLALVGLLFCTPARAAVSTYDNFSSGTISGELWSQSGNAPDPGMFSIQSGVDTYGQPWMLHMTGNGGNTGAPGSSTYYPGSNLMTTASSQFTGFGVGGGVVEVGGAVDVGIVTGGADVVVVVVVDGAGALVVVEGGGVVAAALTVNDAVRLSTVTEYVPAVFCTTARLTCMLV